MHIDHSELTRLLYEHLSQHTEVKNIKVVRDNKGGTCAFVQCEVSLTDPWSCRHAAAVYVAICASLAA